MLHVISSWRNVLITDAWVPLLENLIWLFRAGPWALRVLDYSQVFLVCNKVWEPLWRHSRQMEKIVGAWQDLNKAQRSGPAEWLLREEARRRYVQQELKGWESSSRSCRALCDHGRDLDLCCTVMGSHSSLPLDTSPPPTLFPPPKPWLTALSFFGIFWPFCSFKCIRVLFWDQRVIKETESFSFFLFFLSGLKLPQSWKMYKNIRMSLKQSLDKPHTLLASTTKGWSELDYILPQVF